MSQNYARFGLVAKLGTTTGPAAAANPLAVRSTDRGLLQVREVKVERDADGRIVRVLRDANPLRDPLNDIDSGSDGEGGDDGDDGAEWGGIEGDDATAEEGERPAVIRALEEEASRPVEKTVRHQSERELEWLRGLVARHGTDVAAMARDRKLNPMQQTAADLRKRLSKAGLLG